MEKLFICPNNDLEAKTIIELLEKNGEDYIVTSQTWGASWENLEPEIKEKIEQIMDDLHHLGFDVTPIGGGSFSINGLPSGVEGLSPQALLQSMVASACDGGKFDVSAYRHRIALSLAKSAAIVAGQVLNQDEMDILMSDLLKSSNPSLTPDGKTIIVLLKQESIQKMFV